MDEKKVIVIVSIVIVVIVTTPPIAARPLAGIGLTRLQRLRAKSIRSASRA